MPKTLCLLCLSRPITGNERHPMSDVSSVAGCISAQSPLRRTIAPFNEPSSIYWWAGNNQEGCHFDISTQNIIIGKLQAMLQQKGLAEVKALNNDSSFSRAAHAFVPRQRQP